MREAIQSSSPGSAASAARTFLSYLVLLLAGMMLTGCKVSSPIPTWINHPGQTTLPLQPTYRSTSTLPSPTLSPTHAPPTPASSPTAVPISIWLPPYLPEAMRSELILPEGYIQAATAETADISLDVDRSGNSAPIQWIYALVAPFPTIMDGVEASVLRKAWDSSVSSPFDGAPILLDENTLGILSALWGSPGKDAIKVLPAGELVDYAWSNRPSWAIIPFEQLDPGWKVLTLDGQSPIRKDFDASTYFLTLPFSISGEINPDAPAISLALTNRDASQLTTVAMTGVTAMVRATAFAMETEGITYPGLDVAPILSAADITHISNEIPFWPDCPYPNPYQEGLVFCSRPAYIDLLKSVGADVIDLTGDHFMDYGTDATLYTLQMYQDLGWKVFGGGADAELARQPALFESNGNKIAFMGCNVGCQVKPEIPCDAIATEDHPGASQCDYSYISTEIPKLKADGYQVIFTFQHQEVYKYTAEPQLVEDFGRVAADGAAIVSGSQAHQPHGFAFQAGSFIHYGLGNLFFDQYHFCAGYDCDYAFIDRHVFYAGKYISTELITLKFIDWARPRLMTPEERVDLLQTIFEASGW